MKTLLQPYFLILISLSSTIYLFQVTSVIIPSIINNFFNDLVCLPLVLTICLFVVRSLLKNPFYILNKYEITSVFLLYSILFEFILPKFNDRYTSDYWDILMYFTGSLIFYLFWNKPLNNSLEKI